MSTAGIGAGIGSAGLYAVVTNPAQVGAKPEEAAELRHHLKHGKGFVNPWDSYKDVSPWKLLPQMLWYVHAPIILH
jgi:N-acyl-phosphatidylethanolamine-hydrolysing phospholipase D